MDTAYRTSWIRRIRPIGYRVSDLLGTAYWATPVWCFGVLWYGVLSYSGTVYCISWVRRIELLGYGVLAESVLFLIFDQSIIYDVYTDVDTAYSSKSSNGLLIRQNKGNEVMKDKVSQEHVCEEEVPLNNNIEKQSGDLVYMPSEVVEQGMDDQCEAMGVVMEYFVKISKKARILELNKEI
ncbi:hypothetical protein Tco_0551834 [Tanacetum coccineum]